MCVVGRAVGAESVELRFTSNQAAPDLTCPAPPKPTGQRPKPQAQAGAAPTAARVLAALGEAPDDRQPQPDPALLAHLRLDNAQPRGHRLKIALWGDSHAAAGGLDAALRRVLQLSGLDSNALAFGPVAGRAGVALPLRKHCLAGQWRFEPAYLARGKALRTGPGLANLRASGPGSELLLDLRDAARKPVGKALTLLFAPSTTQVELELAVDGAPARSVVLPAGNVTTDAPARLRLAAAGGLSTVRLRVLRGEFVWQGARLDPIEPQPVQFDVFAFPSATVRGWAEVDVDYLRQSLAGEDYDAVLLQFGTNEGNEEPFDRVAYAELLEAALGRLRAVFPAASCVLLGPTDRGTPLDRIPATEAGPGGAMPMPGRTLAALLRYSEIHRSIAALQAEAAARYRCAAWDWQGFMGGPGSAYRWAQAVPPLGAGDLIHLTPEGYRRSGLGLARWLGWPGTGDLRESALQSARVRGATPSDASNP